MDYSVIIPAHNSEQYIERCLEHVLSSDLGREFEVIVVDDDSGDLTVEKAKRPRQLANGSTHRSALGRTRTSDTRFRKPVLYPLSYEGGAL